MLTVEATNFNIYQRFEVNVFAIMLKDGEM